MGTSTEPEWLADPAGGPGGVSTAGVPGRGQAEGRGTDGTGAVDRARPGVDPGSGVPDLVVKFGGTSLGTSLRIRRAARRIRGHLRRGHRPVVVVSATGHTTDRIVARLQRLSRGGRSLRHSRETDRAIATGEDLSAALLAAALVQLGVRARSLRGAEAGIRADGAYGDGRIRRVDPGRVRRLVSAGFVPVVSGFQGGRPDSETLTLGRGGSDTSAVALAAALGGVPCHIVTDVDAVYDRDPRVAPDAVAFGDLSHDALLALARAGARVVHPAAAELAAAHGVPLLVHHHRAPLAFPGGTRVRTLTSTEPHPS